jgi:hypothetical protein
MWGCHARLCVASSLVGRHRPTRMRALLEVAITPELLRGHRPRSEGLYEPDFFTGSREFR